MTKTLSNRRLEKITAKLASDLAKVRPGSWTAQKIAQSLTYYRRQLSLPREERCKYIDGSL